MDKLEQPSVRLAFKALISSYLISSWQRTHGSHQSLGSLDWIRYSYEVANVRHLTDVFFVADLDPNEALEKIQDQEPADNHLILALNTRQNLVTRYMGEGCSYLAPPSYLMARHLDGMESPPSNHEIMRLSSAGQASIIETIDGADPVSPADLEDPRLDHYVATSKGSASAIARLSQLETGISWASHVYTAAPFRSRGLATALMGRLMQDSTESGDRLMYLLATEEAHSLYRKLGFLDLAVVLNFILL